MHVKLERKHFNVGEFSGKPLVTFVGFRTAAINVPQELHTQNLSFEDVKPNICYFFFCMHLKKF